MWYLRNENRLTLQVTVQPGAKRSDIAGLHGDRLKIRLNSPALEGRANQALVKLIAQLFQVPKRQVVILRGDKSRQKTLCITGSQVDPDSLVPKPQ